MTAKAKTPRTVKKSQVKLSTVKVTKTRLEARIPADVKKLAERAATASGFGNLTDYIVQVLKEDATRRLQLAQEITLTNDSFDRFAEACNETVPLSPKLKEAADLLDNEGF